MVMTGNKENHTNGQVYVRIDNRLLHGQVVQYWLGHLEITHLIVADDVVAGTESMSVIYRMALPESVELTVVPVHRLPSVIAQAEPSSILVLMRDTCDVDEAMQCGLEIDRITLGNIHTAKDRTRVTDSVYLSTEQVDGLVRLLRQGIEVDIQTFPGEVLRLQIDPEGKTHWARS